MTVKDDAAACLSVGFSLLLSISHYSHGSLQLNPLVFELEIQLMFLIIDLSVLPIVSKITGKVALVSFLNLEPSIEIWLLKKKIKIKLNRHVLLYCKQSK